jgi:hypothetical protein
MHAKATEPVHSVASDGQAIKRRNWVLGAGAVGAAALAVKALPAAAPIASVAAAAKTAVDTSGGYQLTAHVQRYYDTARA